MHIFNSYNKTNSKYVFRKDNLINVLASRLWMISTNQHRGSVEFSFLLYYNFLFVYIFSLCVVLSLYKTLYLVQWCRGIILHYFYFPFFSIIMKRNPVAAECSWTQRKWLRLGRPAKSSKTLKHPQKKEQERVNLSGGGYKQFRRRFQWISGGQQPLKDRQRRWRSTAAQTRVF